MVNSHLFSKNIQCMITMKNVYNTTVKRTNHILLPNQKDNPFLKSIIKAQIKEEVDQEKGIKDRESLLHQVLQVNLVLLHPPLLDPLQVLLPNQDLVLDLDPSIDLLKNNKGNLLLETITLGNLVQITYLSKSKRLTLNSMN